MHTNNYCLPSTPQSTWQLIKTAVAIWKSTFLRVVIFSIIIELLSNILLLDNFYVSNKYIVLALMIAISIVTCVANISIIYCMDKLVHNQDTNFYQNLLIGAKKLLPFIAVSIIYALAVLIGTLLLIIPGIMASIYLIFVFYLIIIDKNISIINCIKSSYELVRGRWWHTSWVISIMLLWFILVMLLIVFICLLLGYAVIKICSIDQGVILENLKNIGLIVKSIINIFTTPLLHATILAVLYDSITKNKEKTI